MRKILLFGLIIIGFARTQDLELKTPEGSLKITLSNKSYFLEGDGQLKTAALIGNIEAKLDYLEEMYLAKLKKSDRLIIESLLNEIHFLLSLFPEDYYVIITPYLPIPEPPPIYPMSERDFTILLSRLQTESFSDDQLSIVRTAANSNFFLVGQAETVLDVFSFEDDKLEAVRILYPQVLDKENSFKLYGKFTFSDSKEELAEILRR